MNQPNSYGTTRYQSTPHARHRASRHLLQAMVKWGPTKSPIHTSPAKPNLGKLKPLNKLLTLTCSSNKFQMEYLNTTCPQALHELTSRSITFFSDVLLELFTCSEPVYDHHSRSIPCHSTWWLTAPSHWNSTDNVTWFLLGLRLILCLFSHHMPDRGYW